MHAILSFSAFGIDKIETVSHDKLLHYFNQIQQSAKRLLNLLNDLLDLSKLEASKMEFNFSQQKISSLVRDCLSEMESLNENKELRIDHQLPAFEPIVRCDPLSISQVIRNLFSNAFKFTPKGQSIQICYEQVKDYKTPSGTLINSGILTSITDSGVGIPEDELEFVFDKFAQSSKTKTNKGGTGLGLAICMEIIKAHHGSIWLENNPSGGTVARFVLPVTHKL